MSIEKDLGRIANALEAIETRYSGKAPAADKPKAARGRRGPKPAETVPAETTTETAPDEPTATVVTRDQVRESFRIWRKGRTKQEAVALLGEHGATSISGADEAILPDLLAAFSA